MRIARATCVLASFLSTAALAQSREAFQFRDSSIGVRAGGPQDLTGPRIALELLGGGLGALGGGLGGLLVGNAVSGGDTVGTGVGVLTGLALGSSLGISLGGNAVGGRGDIGATILGTGLGITGWILLGVAMGVSDQSIGLLSAAMFVLPVGGGAIGYEVSHAINAAPPDGPLKSVAPSFSLSKGGKSPLAGLVATF